MALARCARSPSEVASQDLATLQRDMTLMRAAVKYKADLRNLRMQGVKYTEQQVVELLDLEWTEP